MARTLAWPRAGLAHSPYRLYSPPIDLHLSSAWHRIAYFRCMVICDPQLLHQRSTDPPECAPCQRPQCAHLDFGTWTRAPSLQGLRHAPIWRRIGPNGRALPAPCLTACSQFAHLRTTFAPRALPGLLRPQPTHPSDSASRRLRPRARGPAFFFRCTPPVHNLVAPPGARRAGAKPQRGGAKTSPRHAIGAARCGPARCGMPPGPLGAGHSSM